MTPVQPALRHHPLETLVDAWKAAEAVTCPVCKAPPGTLCSAPGDSAFLHGARFIAAGAV